MTTSSLLPDVGIELRDGYAEVGDQRLHYVEAGDGPLIVLLHGIAFRFHARDVHLVLRGRERGTPVPFRVLIDGGPPGDAHGLDVDEVGRGMVAQPRLYQLARQRGPIADRTFEITFLAPGIEAYVFTFG